MAKVNFKRIEDSSNVGNIDIEDGNFIVTGDGKTFIDYGVNRIAVGGTPDNEMSDTSSNTVENKVIKEYIDNNIADITPTKNNNYIKFGNIGICWGQANPRYANVNVLTTSVNLPITFSQAYAFATPINFGNIPSELDVIAKVSNNPTTSLTVALHSYNSKFMTSSTDFLVNYLVIGIIEN